MKIDVTGEKHRYQSLLVLLYLPGNNIRAQLNLDATVASKTQEFAAPKDIVFESFFGLKKGIGLIILVC